MQKTHFNISTGFIRGEPGRDMVDNFECGGGIVGCSFSITTVTL